MSACVLLAACGGGSGGGSSPATGVSNAPPPGHGEVVLYAYQGTTDGSGPQDVGLDADGSVLVASRTGGANSNGTLYRISASGAAPVYAFGATGQGFDPTGLLADSSGTIYGTTGGGGTASGGGTGYGTIYKLAPNATAPQVLYTFTGGADGSDLNPGMIMDAHGNLYGTAQEGGGGSGLTYGTVYELPAGASTVKVLHAFTGSNNDGGNPGYNLVMDSAGNLYGTTLEGGTLGLGVVFEIAMPSGQETILHNFQALNDGIVPGPLVIDGQGNLYGTTSGGGTYNAGTVFKIPAGSSTEQIVYTFQGGSDGSNPSSLVIDGQGNLFGTTVSGGGCTLVSNGCGTIFEIPAGTTTEKVVYAFQGGNTDGLDPVSLILDGSGNRYGTTLKGGPANRGTVFAFYK
jgi:uncharacterized repeat protein (TIGR03803 family)